MDIDWTGIAEKSILLFLGSGSTWVFTSILKMRKDLNAAFYKLRSLEEKIK